MDTVIYCTNGTVNIAHVHCALCTCAHQTPLQFRERRAPSGNWVRSVNHLSGQACQATATNGHQWTPMTPHDINWRSSIQFLKTYFFTICPTFTKTDIFYTNLQSRIQMDFAMGRRKGLFCWNGRRWRRGE